MATKVKARRKSSAWVENIKTIVYAGLIAVVVRTVLFEPFNIPSGSMIPTLLVGDYLFVSKYSYGYSRYSLPFGWPPFAGRIFGSLPNRGDVAVFKYPRDNSTDYIKRIIGLPGDRIQVRQGQLYINGQLCPRQPEGDYVADDNGIHMVLRLYRETLPNGVKHDVIKATDEGDVNNTQEYLVPPDHVFAMGDNRDNSADSRFMNGVGFVPVENLVGRAEIIFFSVDAAGTVVAILVVAVRDSLEPHRYGCALSTSALSSPIETILGHEFARPELLREAMTHRSAVHGRGRPRGKGSNERMEFVGDRVLGLLMAEWLAERFPREQEGDLGRRLAVLVSQPVLAEVAETIGLGEALSVAPGEAKAGVRRRATVLADALEAALGALFLDGGLDRAREFVRRAWDGAMNRLETPPRDAKTMLQEWVQARGLGLPEYLVTSRVGPPHAPEFVVTVASGGVTGCGTAGTKRAAEQLAAQELLRVLGA